MTFSMEDLPAPLGPMIDLISPSLMSNDTSLSAWTPPKRSDTFLMSISRAVPCFPSEGVILLPASRS